MYGMMPPSPTNSQTLEWWWVYPGLTNSVSPSWDGGLVWDGDIVFSCKVKRFPNLLPTVSAFAFSAKFSIPPRLWICSVFPWKVLRTQVIWSIITALEMADPWGSALDLNFTKTTSTTCATEESTCDGIADRNTAKREILKIFEFITFFLNVSIVLPFMRFTGCY